LWVNTIFIYPHSEKGKEIKIIRNGKGWDLQNDKVKTVADGMAVKQFISQFVEMKSPSLGGQEKSSWNDLQVSDTSGSRMKFVSSDNKAYNMIVGKIDYTPSTLSGLTYIRHADEEATYAVSGFLSFTINQGFNIHGVNQSAPVTIQAYPADSTRKYILHSSLNPDAYFSEAEAIRESLEIIR
jgi:hypothetical protein